MKKFFLAMGMAVAAIAANAFTVVTRTSEGTACYSSSDIERIELTKAGGANVYLAEDKIVTIPADQFVSIGFDGNEGIADVAIAQTAFIIEGNAIKSGDGGKIEIYSIDGALATSAKSGIADISKLPAGAYVVKTNSQTAKFYLQ